MLAQDARTPRGGPRVQPAPERAACADCAASGDMLMLASKRLAVEPQALTEPLLPSRRIRRDQPVRVPIDMGLSDAEIWAWAEHESLQVSSSRKRPELAAKGN
jgi:hypothetical protein